jgi:hypothetical protein
MTDKFYQGLENYIMGLEKLFGITVSCNSDVKTQSEGVLAESYNIIVGGDYGRRA